MTPANVLSTPGDSTHETRIAYSADDFVDGIDGLQSVRAKNRHADKSSCRGSANGMLGKGHMKIDQYYPLKPNHLVFTCADNVLTLDVNNGKLKASQSLDSTLEGNITGVGALSSALLPATIDFETVSVH